MNYYNFAEINHVNHLGLMKIMKIIFLILLIFYQKDIDPENSLDQYESNKIPNVIQSEKKQFNNCV